MGAKGSLCSGGAAAACAKHPGWLPPGQHRCGHQQPPPHPFFWLVSFYLSPARGDGLVRLWVGSQWWRVVVKGPVGKEAEVEPGDLPLDGLPHAILSPNSLPPNSLPPDSLPPDSLPLNTVPSAILPPAVLPSNSRW